MEWSSSGLEPRQCLELLSWKVDVEWCSILFPEPAPSSPSSGTDVDWDTLVASLGLVAKLPVTSPPVTSSYRSVKATGVVLLLGLGSYLCYKFYKVWLYQQFQGIGFSRRDDNAPSPPPSSFAEGTPAFSYHHLSNSSATINDLLNVKTRYFGPVHMNNDDNYSENEMTHCQDFTSAVEQPGTQNGWRQWPRERKRRHKMSSPPSVNSRRGWLFHKLQSLAPANLQIGNNNEDKFSNRHSPRGGGNSTGTSSTNSSPMSHPHHSLSRDLSFDSLGLFCRTRREGSIDSMSSELSFDMPSFSEQSAENATVTRLDKLQEEIEQLKSNCQLMDEEFETVKCNRNLPGLSDLMEAAEHQGEGELTVQDIVRRQSAKACFKGLYSLTTINRSMSMDLSLDEDSPQTSSQIGLAQLDEERLPSLEWDEEYCPDDENNWKDPTAASPNQSSKLDTSGYGTTSLTGSQFSCFESPTSPVDAINSELIRSISCESGAEMWSITSSESEPESPMTDNSTFKPLNIGPPMDILSYAQQEWTGNTPTAHTILRGYKEITETLNYRHLRQIRGDNYCALRSALFQTLAQGLAVPSGASAMARLSQAHNVGAQWYQQWRFNSLPYSGTNTLRGMEICLQSLDNISALLRSSDRSTQERENTLSHLLNTDPNLDLHLVEAVKLHMMLAALDLHESTINGQDVPLFSILMYARDTSEVPLDFMNNHLIKVGDSGGLEQVEMFLLGFTLGVTLKVVRPSAHGSQQFVCFYPDDHVGSWPEVALVAEDDRHYNVLCL